MKPVRYDGLNWVERRRVRTAYVDAQGGMCWYCRETLACQASDWIVNKPLKGAKFPEKFFEWPVHLHHDKITGLTIGAVHCHCNAVSFVYDEVPEMKAKQRETPFQRHRQGWADCRLCCLCDQRSRVVLARGSIPCDVLFVGEAPGLSEDAVGVPFYGPAGKLLDYIAGRSLPAGIRWAATNLVACYPREAKDTDDHRPPDESIKACQTRLREFIGICRPKLIVAVGSEARDWLDPKVRGALDTGIETVSIVHPAAVLRAQMLVQGLMVKQAVLTIKKAVAGRTDYQESSRGPFVVKFGKSGT